jgi:hypothetical protein
MYLIPMDLIPQLKTGRLVVALTNHKSIISDLISELALRGPVTVLDGGNCFPAYRITQLVRRKSQQINAISQRVFVQRAFTCYQMVSLLENASVLSHPHIVLNLLSTFQDDQIHPREADRLLTICRAHIERLCLAAPVAITLEPVVLAEKEFLLKRICEKADEVFTSQPTPNSREEQLSFFQLG